MRDEIGELGQLAITFFFFLFFLRVSSNSAQPHKVLPGREGLHTTPKEQPPLLIATTGNVNKSLSGSPRLIMIRISPVSDSRFSIIIEQAGLPTHIQFTVFHSTLGAVSLQQQQQNKNQNSNNNNKTKTKTATTTAKQKPKQEEEEAQNKNQKKKKKKHKMVI